MSELKKQPLVSVIMPVYNAVNFVETAIASIQAQTYPNWELIVVDDLSTDGTWEIVQEWASNDQRITAYRNGRHRGVAGAANLALTMAKGDLVARMDADDISFPDRLSKQVTFLNENPETVAVGGQCLLIDKEGKNTGSKKFPLDFKSVKRMMFYSIPVQQPSLMINLKRLPRNFVWYEESFHTAEEVELLFKFFKYGQVVNINDYVLQYRIHGNNISLRDPKKTFFLTLKTRLISIFKHGYRPTIKGTLITLAQAAVVSVLPSGWIYPVYAFMRGLKNKPLLSKRPVIKQLSFSV